MTHQAINQIANRMLKTTKRCANQILGLFSNWQNRKLQIMYMPQAVSMWKESACGRRHATYATGLCLIVAAGQSDEHTRA